MGETWYVLVAIGVLFLSLLAGMPIGFALLLVGGGGMAVVLGWGGFSMTALVFFNTVSHFTLIPVPLFLLMGFLMFHSGISSDLFKLCEAWLGKLPGGLGVASIMACSVFASATGSSSATVATVGTVAIPEMLNRGYSKRLATGALATGGTLGILIPPSIILVIYGSMVEESIGQLLVAGILPGILIAILLSLTVVVFGIMYPQSVSPPRSFAWKERFTYLKGMIPVLFLIAAVMGTIYTGIATPTEAAAVGAFCAVLLVIMRWKRVVQNLRNSLVDTLRTVGMAYLIVSGATVFSTFLGITGLPNLIANYVGNLPLGGYAILAIILVAYVFLGMVVDGLAMMLMTLPIVYPIIQSLGFDPIWFGIILVIVIEISLITPPVGMNLYIVSGVSGVKLEEVFRGSLLFLIPLLIGLLIIAAVPEISLFLPQQMMSP